MSILHKAAHCKAPSDIFLGPACTYIYIGDLEMAALTFPTEFLTALSGRGFLIPLRAFFHLCSSLQPSFERLAMIMYSRGTMNDHQATTFVRQVSGSERVDSHKGRQRAGRY